MLFGEDISVFIGITLVLFGGTAFMTGQALAQTWRPIWQCIPYALLLGVADRFLCFALFQAPLGSLPLYVLDTALLMATALFAYRATRAYKMVTQYPWLYERAGLLSWRERQGA